MAQPSQNEAVPTISDKEKVQSGQSSASSGASSLASEVAVKKNKLAVILQYRMTVPDDGQHSANRKCAWIGRTKPSQATGEGRTPRRVEFGKMQTADN